MDVEMKQEEHVRDVLWRELNEAVRECGPRRPERGGIGESAERAIVIEDD